MVTLSIIVPVLNEEKNLSNFLKDYKAQNRKADELIFVYTDSKDNSLDLIKTYQRYLPEIKIFYCNKRGPAASRNLGLEKAKSEYVLFMDADWRLLSRNVLGYLYKILEKNKGIDFIGIRAYCKPTKILQKFSEIRKWIYYKDEPFSFHIIKRNFCPRYCESLGFGEDRLFSKELYSKNPKYISTTANLQLSRALGEMNFTKFCRRYIWYGRTIPSYIIKTRDNQAFLGSLAYLISIIPVFWFIPFFRGVLEGLRYVKDGITIPLGLGLLEIVIAYCLAIGNIQWFLGIREISRDL